jgi:hypothetical protein
MLKSLSVKLMSKLDVSDPQNLKINTHFISSKTKKDMVT